MGYAVDDPELRDNLRCYCQSSEGRHIAQDRPLAIAAPRRILVVAALIMVAAAVFGIPVAKRPVRGRFQTQRPNPLSDQAADRQVRARRHASCSSRSPRPTAVKRRTHIRRHHIVEHLKQSPHVGDVTSPWTVPPQAATDLISETARPGHRRRITGGETMPQKYAKARLTT